MVISNVKLFYQPGRSLLMTISREDIRAGHLYIENDEIGQDEETQSKPFNLLSQSILDSLLDFHGSKD